MHPPKQFKTRKEKLKFLKDVLRGKATLNELTPITLHVFVRTRDKTIFYKAESGPPFKPMLEDREVRRYTREEIDAIEKRPNQFCWIITYYDESNRPDFPIVNENGEWLNQPPPPNFGH